MKDKPYYIVDYCMYSNWGYRKRTRIWSNVLTFKPKLCDGSGDCGNMIKIENHNFHLTALGKTSQNKMVKKQHIESKDKKHVSCVQSVGGGTDRLMRYRIPPDLVYDLLCV